MDEGDNKIFGIQAGHGGSEVGAIHERPRIEAVFSVEAKPFGLRMASME